MLTPTDVHYLVGFLTFMSSAEDVEIVLGNPVYDAAALFSVFKGIEVNKHDRPDTQT
jgi:hypothetical protein